MIIKRTEWIIFSGVDKGLSPPKVVHTSIFYMKNQTI
jgi:hypothetical protein